MKSFPLLRNCINCTTECVEVDFVSKKLKAIMHRLRVSFKTIVFMATTAIPLLDECKQMAKWNTYSKRFPSSILLEFLSVSYAFSLISYRKLFRRKITGWVYNGSDGGESGLAPWTLAKSIVIMRRERWQNHVAKCALTSARLCKSSIV